jgi:ribulose-5-phosphate 4-epimerase/fuculose-1-phosphate aldolase
MAIQLVSRTKPVREQVSAEEWKARVELAAGHRVLAYYGVNDMTYNHFGLRVPGEPDHMLIKRTDWMFAEVTASSLLKVDFDHPCRVVETSSRPERDVAYSYRGRHGRGRA